MWRPRETGSRSGAMESHESQPSSRRHLMVIMMTQLQMWIFQIAQGWELHTHLDIIREVLYINNQQRKKLQRILGSATYCQTIPVMQNLEHNAVHILASCLFLTQWCSVDPHTVYSNNPFQGLTEEWFRELSFSRLECGVHDRLHIYPLLCGIFYFPWRRHHIEGFKRPMTFSVSSERQWLLVLGDGTPNNSVSSGCANWSRSRGSQGSELWRPHQASGVPQ